MESLNQKLTQRSQLQDQIQDVKVRIEKLNQNNSSGSHLAKIEAEKQNLEKIEGQLQTLNDKRKDFKDKEQKNLHEQEQVKKELNNIQGKDAGAQAKFFENLQKNLEKESKSKTLRK